MTRRLITISIDANRVTCGKCEQLRETERDTVDSRGNVVCQVASGCVMFGLLLFSGNSGPRRCAPCLAAEKGEA